MVPPINKVLDMKNQGFTNNQIINELKKQKYSKEDITEAIAQADVKNEIEAPSPYESSINPPLPRMPRDIQNQEDNNLDYYDQPPLPQAPMPSAPPQYDELSLSEEAPRSMIAPSPSQTKQQSQLQPQQEFLNRDMSERIQEIAESIIQEKWDDFMGKIGDINLWKGKIDTGLISVKQELIRTNQRFENMEKAILSKTRDYQRTMEDVSSEMKTLEKVFEKIITPLTENIKELSRITKQLKKKA